MWFNRRSDPRIQEELQFQRDRLIADDMAAGMSRRDAERRAFLEFGNVAATLERVKDVRGRWLEELGRDIRFAARTLRKSPAFATTAAATRALAIGTNTAIFRMIIGEGLTLSLIGVAFGLVGALWFGEAASSLLLGVTASDPLRFATVSLLLTAVAIAASYFPARRAMTVDPILALRVT